MSSDESVKDSNALWDQLRISFIKELIKDSVASGNELESHVH